MSRIWAAPFLGEFGWECSVWSPWLRYQQDKLDQPMTVVCERGKALLYEDFAEVVEIDPSVLIRDCQHALTPFGAKLCGRDYENAVAMAAGSAQKCITPIDLSVTWKGGPPAPRFHIYKSYKQDIMTGRNRLAIHARNHQHTDRNWSPARWDDLVSQLKFDCYDVVSIGSKEAALHIEGTTDGRGISLEDLALDLSACDFAVGPSSGPLAFAMLCETPVVWWSGHAKNGPRFNSVWNPFGVKVEHAANNWNPHVEKVYAACRRSS
jgi:hypothetical protein